MELPQIAFTRPYRSSNELANLELVVKSGHMHGDGPFTESANNRLKAVSGADQSLLTTSCTHALEMASLLLDLEPGDEVVMPSFTFPSAATAIANYGVVPVFVDIELLSGNVSPAAIEAAITPRTRAISIVHYGGVGADMDAIGAIAARNGLPIIEDNAHALGAKWRGRNLGTIGTVGTQSFHDTKNIHSGEGGALLVNDANLFERAEVIREKGTNRSLFLRGQVDKYTWTDKGSSYLMSELNAAVLDSQLAEFDVIQGMRHAVWDTYATELVTWASQVGAQLMSPPAHSEHPAHVFYVLMASHEGQMGLLAHLRALNITATFHYVPLHSSTAGMRFGRTPHGCDVSEDFSRRMVRLPLWAGMPADFVSRVVGGVLSYGPGDRVTA
jgi:dTDP-4-amino-4,6-dideoxygalactose transaminase